MRPCVAVRGSQRRTLGGSVLVALTLTTITALDMINCNTSNPGVVTFILGGAATGGTCRLVIGKLDEGLKIKVLT